MCIKISHVLGMKINTIKNNVKPQNVEPTEIKNTQWDMLFCSLCYYSWCSGDTLIRDQ